MIIDREALKIQFKEYIEGKLSVGIIKRNIDPEKDEKFQEIYQEVIVEGLERLPNFSPQILESSVFRSAFCLYISSTPVNYSDSGKGN